MGVGDCPCQTRCNRSPILDSVQIDHWWSTLAYLPAGKPWTQLSPKTECLPRRSSAPCCQRVFQGPGQHCTHRPLLGHFVDHRLCHIEDRQHKQQQQGGGAGAGGTRGPPSVLKPMSTKFKPRILAINSCGAGVRAPASLARRASTWESVSPSSDSKESPGWTSGAGASGWASARSRSPRRLCALIRDSELQALGSSSRGRFGGVL